MKKIILLFATLSFGLAFSQKSKTPSEKTKNKIPSNPYHQLHSSDTINVKKESNKISFYKNVDSANASKYRMLSKKPSEQYSELSQNKEINQKEKNK